MTIAKDIPTNNSYATINYILEDSPHNTKLVQQRNLMTGIHNIHRDYAGKINKMYIESQFYGIRKASGRSNKRTQAHHLIFSFSDQEFPVTRDPKQQRKQAKQAGLLINGFLKEQLPEGSQYLLAVQRDGDGAKLHVHVCLNSVLTTGKVLDTNYLSIVRRMVKTKDANGKTVYKAEKGLFDNLQDYMAKNFKKSTGRDYQRLSLNKNKSKSTNVLSTSKDVQIRKRHGQVWRQDLADIIKEVVNHSSSLDDFKKKLWDVYRIKTKDYKSSTGKKDANGKNIKRDAYTYYWYYDPSDKTKLRRMRDFHITKRGAVRGLGGFARPDDLQAVIDHNLQLSAQIAQNTQSKQAPVPEPEPELTPKPNAVQNLQKAKDVTESKSGQKADSLKQAVDSNIQRVQEQKQARATDNSATHKKKKKKQTKSAQQLKKEQNARLDAELHNKIQNLDEPWKDNQDQDEDGFDDFNDF